MKGRKHKETGGANDAEEDLKTKNEARTNAKNIDSEAEEMKKGGRAKKHRARGGKAGFGPEKHGSDEPKVSGEKPNMHAGRKPRKSGGRSGSDSNPLSSARTGNDAPGRKLMKGEYAMGED
jgi:hypothetical protein